jgi:competence protein ComEC
VRKALELHWPSLLVGGTCLGLALSNWVSVSLAAGVALAVLGLAGVALLDGSARVAALGFGLAVLGLAWGSLRLEAMDRSVLTSHVGESASVEAVTTSPARTSPWAIRVIGTTRSYGGLSLRERVLLVLPPGRAPPRGTILEAAVRVEEPRPREGSFDERAWLERQGVHVVLRSTSWRAVGRRTGLAGVGDRLRDRVEGAVARGTDGVRRGIVLGVVLGEDEGLPRSVQDDFRASGLMHLLAVSGQNVAFIVIGIHGLGWLLRLSRVVSELVALAAIAAYVLAVGWQPSVIRAGVAGAVVSLAWLAARPRDRWHALAVGALVLLAWTPASLLEPGFQLSFAAVIAIFVAVPRARRLVDDRGAPVVAADAVAVATVCGLATAPIVLYHFDRAPVYTVAANVLAFPAMPAVLGLGLLAAAVDPVAPPAAAALAWLAGWAAAWLDVVARLVAGLPGAQVGTRTAITLALVTALAWVTVRRAGRRFRLRAPAVASFAAAAAVLLAAGWWAFRPAAAWTQPAGLRVTFLDVGQGDSVLLETASARVLVDEGPPEADVAGQLAGMGIRTLSALVLTHPQRDHVGGAADVIGELGVGAVLDPGLLVTGPEREEAVAGARRRHVPVRVARRGDEFRIGGLVLEVLWPDDPGGASEDPNQNAIVLLASYGETDVLLPADAESDVTGSLPIGEIEILKVAHHGSEDPGLGDQLRTLRPRIAVISCGRGNDYGHPRPGTLAALAGSPGLTTFRTDLDGRVVVESDGRHLRVTTSA